MRPLILSLGAFSLILGTAWSQSSSDGASSGQVPVGQTFKNFTFPIYQQGELKATLNAIEATGITQNRAATTDVTIKIYENNIVTTTVTSPKADLYVADRTMRTKNTVKIERSDMQATAQTCDFDMKSKNYVLRSNVKVILKNFDAGSSMAPPGSPSHSPGQVVATGAPPVAAPPLPRPPSNNDSMLESPGAYANTNTSPIFPVTPDK